jgi:chemotaxis signal transduction protein
MVTVQAPRTVNWLRCVVGEASVGVDLTQVVGVERGDRLALPPTETDPGRLLAAGGEVPVFPISWWFTHGIPPFRPGGQIILVESSRGRFGLLVDRVAPVARIAAEQIVPPPPGLGFAATRLISGVVVSEEGPVAILNIDELDPTHEPEADPPPRPTPRPAVRARGAHSRTSARLLTFARVEPPGRGGRPVVIGLPVGAVDEVCDVPAGNPVAGGEEHVRELVAVRGRPMMLADAARWVGLPTEESFTSRRVVVVRVGEHKVAVSAGSGVQVLPATIPCIPLRHRLPLRQDRLLGAFDASDFTIIVPRWTALVDGSDV